MLPTNRIATDKPPVATIAWLERDALRISLILARMTPIHERS
jgi:hypothetical protein